jgi:hypothetical protein
LHNYTTHQGLPRGYKQVLAIKYRRTHTILLAVVPLTNEAKLYLQTMAVVFALESFFMFKFLTFRTRQYLDLTKLCAWSCVHTASYKVSKARCSCLAHLY